jgi:hypothetical protein
LFNIDKKNVSYFQAAGIFNLVGKQMTGVQAAGISNTVLSSVNGLQLAGINNHVGEKMNGVQIAGISNYCNREAKGLQLSGIFNYAKKLTGVQIGLINVADSSNGIGIGLINIVIKGYHKISLRTNEVLDLTASIKTGNARLYNIILAGMRSRKQEQAYSFGYGLGCEAGLNKKKSFTLNSEISCQYLYLGSWNYTNLQNKLQLDLQFRFNKYFSISAGPSYSIYYSDQPVAVNGYMLPALSNGYKKHIFSSHVSGWIGWQAGINFF